MQHINYSLCSIKIRRICSTDAFYKNSKNWNSVCSTCLYCTAPEFNANAVPALRKMFNLFFSSFPTPILWSFTNRLILLVLWCCYGQIWLLDVRILCTEPWFCHWGPSAPKKNDKPGYVRYNTFFHAPKTMRGNQIWHWSHGFPIGDPYIVGCAWLRDFF